MMMINQNTIVFRIFKSLSNTMLDLQSDKNILYISNLYINNKWINPINIY